MTNDRFAYGWLGGLGHWRWGVLWALAMVHWSLTLCAAIGPDVHAIFQAARTSERAGDPQAAFLKYLAIPGGEYAAVTLARGDAMSFLTLLLVHPPIPPSPRARLVEAELLLATGQRAEARERFRALASTAPKSNWDTDTADYYPVEPPMALGGDDQFAAFARHQPALPFTYGPGSHRDNWLLRRR